MLIFQLNPIINSKSKIISNNLFQQLNDWINPLKSLKFKLIFSATINGDKFSDFHKFCDNKGSTLSLVKTKKFIELKDNEFKISQELIDDNDVFDWNNLLLPYIYEKITSMAINTLLNFKEILLVKYACTIGTIFDVQTVDKINPMNVIIKREDLDNIMEKLSNEYIIEIFQNERGNRKNGG